MSDVLKRLIRRKESIESVVLGDVNHMNLIELEAMVLHHKQQIKDIAKHLLELKQLITPMMEFKRREWVGLTDEEIEMAIESTIRTTDTYKYFRAVEAKLKEKNT